MGGAIPPSSYILTDDGNKRQRCFHAATPHAVALCGPSAGTGPRSRGRAGPGPRLPPPCPLPARVAPPPRCPSRGPLPGRCGQPPSVPLFISRGVSGSFFPSTGTQACSNREEQRPTPPVVHMRVPSVCTARLTRGRHHRHHGSNTLSSMSTTPPPASGGCSPRSLRSRRDPPLCRATPHMARPERHADPDWVSWCRCLPAPPPDVPEQLSH